MTLDPKTKYRSVFISDTHLGMRSIDSTFLLDFLKSIDCETLYLVGDIVDVWALKNKWYWPNINNEIITEIFNIANTGTKVIYTPGNHDEAFREYIDTTSEIKIQKYAIHYGLNGKKYLVTHGDLFDSVMQKARWLVKIGTIVYELMFFINIILNKCRNLLGRDYWSLSQWSKTLVKGTVGFMTDFEGCLIAEARHEGCDGVISGHIHNPKIIMIEGIEYMNCGDFVENNTCLVEDYQGNFKIVRKNKWR